MLQWAILKKLNKEPNGSFTSAMLTKKKNKENENQDGWVWLIEERTGEQDDEVKKKLPCLCNVKISGCQGTVELLF